MKLHQRAQVQFEVYGKQAGRWLIHGVCPERDLALGLAQSLRRRADTSAVRVVRETYYPDRDEAF